MRLPMMARYRVSTLSALALSGVLLAGCAGESTRPAAVERQSEVRTAPFAPTAAQKALVGVSDGTYTFDIDPTQSQTLQLGASRLDIPSDAVCDLDGSSYGPSHWNDACERQTKRFTITAIVRNAATDNPSVDFEPALRFSPDKNVVLTLFVSNQATLDNTRLVNYCTATGCVDESAADQSLQTYIDPENRVAFRRIKHFSGYVFAQLHEVAEDVYNLY